jgi:hypothetical protein
MPPQLLGLLSTPASPGVHTPSVVPWEARPQIAPEGQIVPHPPQLFGSCPVSTHTPWQQVPGPLPKTPSFPNEQALPSLPDAQVEGVHTFPMGKHRSPAGHAPGLVTWTVPSMYSVQMPMHRPPAHVLPVGQAPPQMPQF